MRRPCVRWLALTATSLLLFTSTARAEANTTSTWEVTLNARESSVTATLSAPAQLLQRHISPTHLALDKDQLEAYARDRTGVRVQGTSCHVRSTRASIIGEMFTRSVEYTCPAGEDWELSNTLYATSRFNAAVLATIHTDDLTHEVIFDSARTRWVSPNQHAPNHTKPNKLNPLLVAASVIAIIAAIMVLRRLQTRQR